MFKRPREPLKLEKRKTGRLFGRIEESKEYLNGILEEIDTHIQYFTYKKRDIEVLLKKLDCAYSQVEYVAEDIVKICEQIKQKKETNSVEPTTSIPAHGSMGDAESL